MLDQNSGYTHGPNKLTYKLIITDGDREMSLLLSTWNSQAHISEDFCCLSFLLTLLWFFIELFFLFLLSFFPTSHALFPSILTCLFSYSIFSRENQSEKKDNCRLSGKDFHHFDSVTEYEKLILHSCDMVRIVPPVLKDMIKNAWGEWKVMSNNIRMYLIS